jgi:hypothetical protein
LLRDLRLSRHQVLAQGQLDTCHAELAQAGLLEQGTDAVRWPLPLEPPGQPKHRRGREMTTGRFVLCPGQKKIRAG